MTNLPAVDRRAGERSRYIVFRLVSHPGFHWHDLAHRVPSRHCAADLPLVESIHAVTPAEQQPWGIKTSMVVVKAVFCFEVVDEPVR